jgi:hypothetical protein
MNELSPPVLLEKKLSIKELMERRARERGVEYRDIVSESPVIGTIYVNTPTAKDADGGEPCL